jgi:hypothetical protein
MSHFRHAFQTKEFRLFGLPQIHEIEAIGIVTAHMSPTGWE